MARPTEFEQRRRVREFWRALADSGSLVTAMNASGMPPHRVIDLLEDPIAMGAAGALLKRAA